MSSKYAPRHHRNTFKWSGAKDITTSSEKSKFDNPRYDNTTKYRQNWIDLRKQLREHDLRKRRLHLDAILVRIDEISDREDPPFLNLIFRLRVRALIIAYFPEGSSYEKKFVVSKDHPGWKDFMTQREREILKMYMFAIENLKNGVSDDSCADFTAADKEFGWYRHQRWTNSLGKVKR